MRIYYFGELVTDTNTQTDTDQQSSSPATAIGDVLRDNSPYKPRQTRRPQHQAQVVRNGLFPAVKFMFGAGAYGGATR